MDVVRWSINFLEGFHDANSLSESDCVSKLVLIVKWCKPGRGCFKANIDAAVDKNNCCIGTSCIIRDCRGVVRRSFTKKFLSNYTSQAAEALALLCGIRGIVDAGMVSVEVEYDAKVVVDMVNLRVVPSANIGNIIVDIHLLTQFNLVTISFVPKSVNLMRIVLLSWQFPLWRLMSSLRWRLFFV
ncbi:hypothetical protein LWI28_027515 [Acer negundo]|uniref:RNase H type-1 domain-containing protein n=1 Tax=Acer negundo TaxID=4023 RepID=A0AAD5NMD9_ACENE|nr:hypothetical protein LWI28_027515 [Acer negundo]